METSVEIVQCATGYSLSLIFSIQTLLTNIRKIKPRAGYFTFQTLSVVMKGRRVPRLACLKWNMMTGRRERKEKRSPRLETRKLSLTRIITRI